MFVFLAHIDTTLIGGKYKWSLCFASFAVCRILLLNYQYPQLWFQWLCCLTIFSMNDSLAKSPELHYPTLKFEDVGGNEETLMVSTLHCCFTTLTLLSKQTQCIDVCK